MGNSHASLAQKLNELYDTECELNHQQFGNVLKVQNKLTKYYYFIREFIFQNENLFYKKLDLMKNKQAIQQQNSGLLQIYEIQGEKDGKMCGEIQKIFLIFEYSDLNLQQVINEKIKIKQNFSEIEIIQVLTGVVNGLHTLAQQGISTNNISIHSINFGWDKSQINILLQDPEVFNTLSLLEQRLDNNMQDLYLSPLQFQKYLEIKNTGKTMIEDDTFKSDIFSLGICTLHMCSLESQEDLYDYQTGQVYQESVYSRIRMVCRNFSDQLVQILYQMLKIDEDSRIDIFTLQQKLNNESKFGLKGILKNTTPQKSVQFSNDTQDTKTTTKQYRSQRNSQKQSYVNQPCQGLQANRSITPVRSQCIAQSRLQCQYQDIRQCQNIIKRPPSPIQQKVNRSITPVNNQIYIQRQKTPIKQIKPCVLRKVSPVYQVQQIQCKPAQQIQHGNKSIPKKPLRQFPQQQNLQMCTHSFCKRGNYCQYV